MMHGKMCPVHKVAYALVLIGALNWGLMGLAGLNLVNSILGSAPSLERLVYVLVGLSALAMLFQSKCHKCCGGECKGGSCKGGSCKGEMGGSGNGGAPASGSSM